MKLTLPLLALTAALSLAACDRAPVVVTPTVPVPVPVPGPAGPAGATGGTGATGATGATGSGTTIIVPPAAPASAPAN